MTGDDNKSINRFKIYDCLGKKEINILIGLKDISIKKGISIYLVGGALRDLLLGLEVKDIDICLNDNPVSLIESMEQIESFKYYEDFQTANVKFKNGVSVDLIRCRKEFYPYPGSLPQVVPSNISEDLYRRDFTINALAYDLLNDKLIDFYKGIEHLKSGQLVKVHENSYLEDPTRILRGIKYSTRYGFILKDVDEIVNCINNNIFLNISNDRIMKEICLICNEKHWIKSILECNNLNMFRINRECLGKDNIIVNYSDINARLLNLYYSLEKGFFKDCFINNSCLPSDLKSSIKSFSEKSLWNPLELAQDNYEIYEILKNSTLYERMLLCWYDKIKYKTFNFEKYLKNIKLMTSGSSLKDMGIKEGKKIGDMLRKLLQLKISTGIYDERKLITKVLERK